VIIVDVGRSMGRQSEDGRATGLDNAKHAMQLMIQQKLLFTKQDEMAIILLGTEETENALNEEDPESYQHICVLKQLQVPDLNLLEAINSIEASSSAEGDCVDAILVAMHLLHARVGKLRFQKRIYLITDGAAPILDDPEAMQRIEEGMRRDEFKLNIIGIGFKEDDEDEDEEDEAEEEYKAAKKEEQKEEDGNGAAAAAAADDGYGVHGAGPGPGRGGVKKEFDDRTDIQRFNESFLKRFASNVDGMVFNISSAIQLLSVFRSRSVNQVTKFRGPLEVSPACIFQVWAYSKTQMQNMPTMKKMVVRTDDASSAAGMGMGEEEKYGGGGGGGGWGGDEDEEGGYGGSSAASSSGGGNVQMERTYLNQLDETGQREVPADMRIKSFRYGKEQVPFSEEDLEHLKFRSEKGIKILSFVPQKLIPRHHYISTVDCIVAQPGDYTSALGLSALIHACYDTAKVAVVRYVKRQDANPLLGILIPVVKADMEAFYFNQLPFEEDIRDFPFSGLEDVHLTDHQKAAALELVRSMNLMTAARDDDDEPIEALKPRYTFNPALQRFYQCVERRALDPEAPIDELHPSIQKYILPDPSLMRQAAPKIRAFKQAFQLKLVEAKEKSKKRNWKDWYSSEVQDADVEMARKRMREQAEGAAAGGGDGAAAAAGAAGEAIAGSYDSRSIQSDFSLDAAMSAPVDHVGSVNPVSDFLALLSRRADPDAIPRAMDELVQRIREFIEQSYRGSYYDRALECLRVLRKECVRLEEADRFNRTLNELKQAYGPGKKRHEEFYERMKQTTDPKLLPITDTETSASSVTEEEANRFYEEGPTPPVSASPQVSGVEDELFDSME